MYGFSLPLLLAAASQLLSVRTTQYSQSFFFLNHILHFLSSLIYTFSFKYHLSDNSSNFGVSNVYLSSQFQNLAILFTDLMGTAKFNEPISSRDLLTHLSLDLFYFTKWLLLHPSHEYCQEFNHIQMFSCVIILHTNVSQMYVLLFVSTASFLTKALKPM